MLNVGIIGVGSISDHHIQSFISNESVALTALCDINQSRLETKGEVYGVTELYQSYKELLKNESIDAVSICTWNNTHAEIAIAALEAGKHVLVEKPISMTVEEAERIEATVEKTGKVLQVGFVRRHAENTKVLKRFIDDGALGGIYYAKASCIRRLGNPGGWFSDQTKSGGGPLIDLGVHMIDLCWYLMGRPRPVSISGNTYKKLGNRSNIENLSFYKASDYNPELNDVEDLANALIRFNNGASLFVDVSFSLHAKEDELAMKLYGDKGGAELEPELVLTSEKQNTILNMKPEIDFLSFNMKQAFQKEIDHFVSSCLEGTENIAPVSDGVQVMKMLRGVYESANLGSEIYL